MANIYTHYLFAKHVISKNPNLDENAFILGSIIADSNDLNHEITHPLNPEDILDKYLLLAKNKIELSFIYGYYLHLLVDKYYHIKSLSTINVELFKLDKVKIDIIDYIDEDIINRQVDRLNACDELMVLDDSEFINEYLDIITQIIDGWLKPNKNYTSLLMDLDDTIFDFKLAEELSLKYVFEKHGIECTKELVDTYKEVNHQLWQDIEDGKITKDELNDLRFTITFEKLGLNTDIGPLCGKEYREELGQRHDYIKGAENALKILSSKYDISIITNGVSKTQRSRISQSNLLSYVNNVFISSDIGYEKPHTKYFRYVLDEIKEKNIAKILVIGDRISSDIKGANSAHLDAIWISDKYQSNNQTYITMMPSITSLYTFLNRQDL